MELLHATGVRLGLVTNGEHWMLVDAPRGRDDRLRLLVRRALAGGAAHAAGLPHPARRRRFFGVADDDTLEALLAESASRPAGSHRPARLSGAPGGRGARSRRSTGPTRTTGGTLLADVPETELYEAALTVMMRLVFLFCAEERGLLLLGDPLYDQHYAVSTLREQLREDGRPASARRCWSAATTPGPAAGHLPGRLRRRRARPAAAARLRRQPVRPRPLPVPRRPQAGTRRGETTPATPLPVNNRTVLHLLEALQVLQVQGARRRPGRGPAAVSFRALDIEQIGHVYEGLLDHTAKRATEPMPGAGRDQGQGAGGRPGRAGAAARPRARRPAQVPARRRPAGRRVRSKKALATPSSTVQELASASAPPAATTTALLERVQPFAGLRPARHVRLPGRHPHGQRLRHGGDRPAPSGTHYTPAQPDRADRPVHAGAAGLRRPRRGQAEGSSGSCARPGELLDLKVCDMARAPGRSWSRPAAICPSGWSKPGNRLKPGATDGVGHHAVRSGLGRRAAYVGGIDVSRTDGEIFGEQGARKTIVDLREHRVHVLERQTRFQDRSARRLRLQQERGFAWRLA